MLESGASSREAVATCDPRRGWRVALVYPPFDDKRDRSAYYLAPPLGLLYLASYLEKEGHVVEIHDQIFELKSGALQADCTLYRQCSERILRTSPDVVCFSTQCTTSPGAVNIARLIKKERQDIPVIFGGHDVSFIADRYLRSFPEIDFVLAGEAELSLPALIAALQDGLDTAWIPGLFARRTENISSSAVPARRIRELDELLQPALHLVAPLSEYFFHSRQPTILVDSGRGCAFSCEFCQTTLLNGTKVRYRGVPSLVAELADYRQKYGPYEAYFVHDLFTARRDFVESLCDALIEVDLGITWQCRCRLDQVDRPLLEKMARAGCRMLLYGVESGSPETLARMNKRAKVSHPKAIVERVGWTVEAGIFPSLSMVVGTPEETLGDLDATMALAHAFVRLGSVNAFIQLMSPLPGTALAARVEHRFAYHGSNAPTAFSQGIEFLSGQRLAEDEMLIQEHPDIFQSFQAVVPDHGDLDLCIDISLTYCKLLEIYQRSFGRLAELAGLTHLGLFRAWRDGWLTVCRAGNLAGQRDHDIWNAFERFIEDFGREELQSDGPLGEAYRFEKVLRLVSEGPPIQSGAGTTVKPARLQLADGARLFESRETIEGFSPAQAALIFATPDRLHVLPLGEDEQALVHATLDEQIWGALSAKSRDRLLASLDHLVRLGVLVTEARDGSAALVDLCIEVA
ncbi:B12-binding domain-containing radical SAM protein [Chenggangzhangella methanolivorans]|uniref:B12-binding domain-containing radical SAM protein n=1 Tax=Chenggangzhangella methanolivorans TaxID=1437009 RepID=UPI00360FDFDA